MMRLKGQLTIVENRTTAYIFPHLFFFPLKQCRWKRISKGRGKAQEKMVRRTVPLTGFSILWTCVICMHLYTAEQTQTQMMAAKPDLFFYFFKHTPEVPEIPETFGRLSHLMTITRILQGKRMLGEGQTAMQL